MRQKKVQNESSQQSQQYRLQKWKKSNRKYSRITPQVKDKLIFLIVRSNMSIKQAANSVKINYSSAKFIFNQYRHKNQKCENVVTGGCSVVIKPILKGQNINDDWVELRCTVGGKFQSQGGRVYSAEEIYNINAGGERGNTRYGDVDQSYENS